MFWDFLTQPHCSHVPFICPVRSPHNNFTNGLVSFTLVLNFCTHPLLFTCTILPTPYIIHVNTQWLHIMKEISTFRRPVLCITPHMTKSLIKQHLQNFSPTSFDTQDLWDQSHSHMEIWEMHTRFWWGNLKLSHHLRETGTRR